MLRLGEDLAFLSVVTGTGRNGDGGGELKCFFSSGDILIVGGDGGGVEFVDNTERRVLRRPRMTAFDSKATNVLLHLLGGNLGESVRSLSQQHQRNFPAVT